ncbi:MAG: sugar ABC transporter substrate-binding protein [Spirochaetales bacterium]|nr:sugar ABC transporter substrate-binding protein [Spirochaetales bacterium]
MKAKTKSKMGIVILIILLFAFPLSAGGQKEKKPSVKVAEKPTVLKVSSEVGIHTEAWKKVVADFEKKYNAKVELTQYPFSKYREMLMVDYTSGNPSYDVSYISYGWYRSLVGGDYLNPFSSGLLKEINAEDIPNIELYREKGNIYFIPFMNEIAGLIYRTDLFNNSKEKTAFKNKYGYELEPPKTFKQYHDVAEFFTRTPNLYGVSMMGKRSVFLTVHFVNRLWGNGGNILDKNYKPIFNQEPGIKALKDLKMMLKDYTNPSDMTHLFSDAVGEFQQGKTAMIEIWSTVFFYANDPSKSKVAGKVAFAPIPRNERYLNSKIPYLYICWGFVVNKKSKHTDLANKFVAFITNKENEVKTAPYGNIPARFSALKSNELNKELPWMKDIHKTMMTNKLTPIYPWIPEGGTISANILAVAVSEYLSGQKSAKQALDDAAKKVHELLSKGGYYK